MKRKLVETYQFEINHFVTQIQENQKNSESAVNGLNVLIASEAAKRSMEEKRRITFSSLKPSQG